MPLQELVQHNPVEKSAEPETEQNARCLRKMPLLGLHEAHFFSRRMRPLP
jgi:hypothetical protein